MTKLLAIDDDPAMCTMLAEGLAKHGYEVTTCTSGEEALEELRTCETAAVITDLNLGQMSGVELCTSIAERWPDVPVIVITAFGSMQTAISAMRAGAYDFITKPVDVQALAFAVKRALQHRDLEEEVKRLRTEDRSTAVRGELIGDCPGMRKVYDLIGRLQGTDANVLISGESGTGKELVARALHGSDTSTKPFVAINCAAVPANLLESELFGHVRGAFTDAKSSRVGLFQKAQGGTIFLDEIAEMPQEMQPKLLRALQERSVRPVGGNADVQLNVRVLAATNRDLETEVEEERFREDLYYRLNVVGIHVPPLRSRGNDILALAQHFLERAAQRLQKEVTGISAEAAKKLLAYDWPGNVRQLENCIERAVTLTRFDTLSVDDLPEKIQTFRSSNIVLSNSDTEHMLSLQELEHRYIEHVLQVAEGNKTQAAKILGLDRRTLYRKLERYDSEGS